MITDPPEAAKPEAPDAARATDYLAALLPPGRLAVFAIVPDGPTNGRTFTLPQDRDGVEAWIAAWLDSANLYFTLNEPSAPERQVGKGGRVATADIHSLRGLVLDLDPDKSAEQRPGGLEAERARLRGLVGLLRGHLMCEPTAVVDSGAGYQLTYVFPAPLPATPENVARVVDQARGLAKAFGGDATHDVAHLFRIPHTRNLPNAAKRGRGRTQTVATVVFFPEARIELDWLAYLAPPIAAPAPAEAAAAFDCAEALAYIGAPEDLPAPLQAKLDGVAAGSQPLRRALNPDLAAEHFGDDRSGRDFAIAAALRDDGGFTKLEAACVIAAYSPGKVEQRGESYLAGTVQRAWERVQPAKTAADYFDAGAAAEATRSELATRIEWLEPTQWQGREPPAREWEVRGFIPRGEVTLLYGEGGIGKTLLAHQYATAAATGRPFLGQITRPAKVMCFFCEDSAEEIERRQTDINRMLGVEHADLENLRISARRTMDNLLAVWTRNTGEMRRQAVWDWLRADALAFGADVLILDTLADIFGGSEIDRAQVSAFMKGCLGKLAHEIGGSAIVLGHPSQAGVQSGSGTSGSSAWGNAARSRLYLHYPKGIESGNFRELEGMKANYGPKGNTLKLQWRHGAFDALSASVAVDVSGASLLPQSADAAEAAIISVLIGRPSERLSMAKNSQFYAPKVLKRLEVDALASFSVPEIHAAIERLLGRKTLREGEVGRDFKRRAVFGLIVVADNLSGSANAGSPEPQPDAAQSLPQSSDASSSVCPNITC